MTDLLIERQGRTTVLTLNRPEARNALNDTIKAELRAAIVAFNADPDQAVAIITGAGQGFCSGGDLKEMADYVEAGEGRLPIAAEPDLCGVAASEKPVIAAVNGAAVAGGFELALSCDIRIAAEPAWFGVFEARWGLVAGIAVNVLPRLVSMGVAMDLLLACERLSAADAHRLGLVQQVTAPGDLMEAALAKAHAIAANSPAAVMGTKKILKFWRDALSAEHHRYYEAVAHRVLLSGDVKEGPRAFAEKREPKFSRGWPAV